MSISKSAAKKLRDLYLGQTVIIYLKDTQVPIATEDAELSVTAMIQAFIIDIDTDFIHTGTPDGIITKSIQHELAGMIEVMHPGEEFSLDIPSNEDEVH